MDLDPQAMMIFLPEHKECNVLVVDVYFFMFLREPMQPKRLDGFR